MEADLRQLFDERFKNILEQIAKLDSKTEKLGDKIDNIILSEKDKCNTCINAKRIDEIESKSQDLNFFVRNPKIAIAVITGTVLMSLMLFSEQLPGVMKVNERLTKFEYYYRHPNEPLIFRGDNPTKTDTTKTEQ